jgi:hypothetical protein
MYFAGQSAGYLLGSFSQRELGRPVAASLRGSANTPDDRADALERSGLTARVVGKHHDARHPLCLALAEHRRAGNLRGEQFLWHLLGELYEDGKHFGAAVGSYSTRRNHRRWPAGSDRGRVGVAIGCDRRRSVERRRPLHAPPHTKPSVSSRCASRLAGSRRRAGLRSRPKSSRPHASHRRALIFITPP